MAKDHRTCLSINWPTKRRSCLSVLLVTACLLVFVGLKSEGSHGPKSHPRNRKLLIVTAVHPHKCSTPNGDYLNVLSLKNKYDFALLHDGYDVYVGSDNVDSKLTGPWNKIALLQQVIGHTSYEWYLWIDSDALFVNMTFSIPFSSGSYAGKDIILWGNYTATYDIGHPVRGLNSGVMLLRGSSWTKSFLADVASLAGDDKKELLKAHTLFEEGLYEQNAMVYLMKTGGRAKFASHVLFDEGEGIQTYYKWLADDAALRSRPAFVSHFPGCQFCSGSMPDRVERCIEIYHENFKFANQQVVQLFASSEL
mmetsp:Transcript_38516/g.62408  ORF Transcript_38516/g.62408 Transcript_38516/m.62408 type:complete len:309 (-) Transcript_38516:133-1059(-)|eukprot:CAMPEP_0184656064 /NCGR_PEP_ID=MMETSP0308-20130426/15488_1 /TAXON_ID=38269 /ORGANISM="Gloeochaete witrockiana, Strain SAG 46.84" /LENGTH=308 /DNA_ID=CAMNT_0027092983 /DNA_START=198 /DNA_END=1124 /DNA_ORIENTATION=+